MFQVFFNIIYIITRNISYNLHFTHLEKEQKKSANYKHTFLMMKETITIKCNTCYLYSYCYIMFMSKFHIYIYTFLCCYVLYKTAEDQSKPLSTFRNKIFKKWHKHIVTFYIACGGLGVGGGG